MQEEDQKILDNQLYEYIEKGVIPKVEMLLLLGADMNSFNDKGMTAVNSVRDVETLKFLIEKGANIEEVDARRIDLFYHLIWRQKDPKNTKLMKYMIDNKLVDVHRKNDVGETIAYFAVRQNNLDALKLIVEEGINVNETNLYGRTLLHKCVEEHLWESRIEMVKYLVEKGADVNIKNNKGNTPLMDAVCFSGKDDLMERLIEYGADVNVVNNEGVDLFRHLLDENKADLTNVKLIFDNGFKYINSKYNGDTFLTYVISRFGNKDIANYLIDKGCDVNEKNDKGQTPLMLMIGKDGHMVSCFDKESIFNLIEKSDDINATDDEGKGVLDYVVESKYDKDLSVYVKLFEKGLEIDKEKILENYSAYRVREYIFKAQNIVENKKEAKSNLGQKKRSTFQKMLIGVKRELGL